MVYEIYTIGNLSHVAGVDIDDSVYKYGITSMTRLSARPQSQIAGCVEMMGEPCAWAPIDNQTGFFAARTSEIGFITRYAEVYGHCPPGQYTSCR